VAAPGGYHYGCRGPNGQKGYVMAIDNKQVARRMIEEVYNKGKIELIEELIDPAYEGHDPLMGTVKRDGLRESVKGYRSAFPDLKLEVNTIIAEGNFVVTRWTARGTHRGALMGIAPTGKSTVVTGIDFAELKNGKISSQYSEFDALGMMRTLGVEATAVPAPGKAFTESSTSSKRT
jgi:steroid delta-isomerase-like uncharacterized protein